MIQVRTKQVRKSNAIIQHSRFNLSLSQQKILLYLISKINPFDNEFKVYDFLITDFIKVCGIEYNGKNNADIKKAIQDFADKSLWVEVEKGKERLLRWIDTAEINKGTGTIKIELHRDMKPYLLELKANYTQYELFWTLKMKSKYSIRLYELVKSIHYNELEEYSYIFDLEDLKRKLSAEHYKTWQKFKDKVLDKAISEINKYSDKKLSYEVKKQGKKIIGISLHIKTKDLSERNQLYYEISEDLGYNQMMIEGFDE